MPTITETPFVNVVQAAKQLGFSIDLSGNADCSTALNTVIGNSPTGATIYFPGGTYLIRNTILLRNSQRYQGANNALQSSTIRQGNSCNLAALFASAEFFAGGSTVYPGNPITIALLNFDGNAQNNPTQIAVNDTTGPGGTYGVNNGIVIFAYRTVIEQCYVGNMNGSGILIASMSVNRGGIPAGHSAVENRIERCTVEGFGNYGIFVSGATGGCTDGYIRDCVVNGAGFNGEDCIAVNEGAGWFIGGNHVYGGQQSGITVQRAYATSLIDNEVDGYAQGSQSGQYLSGIGVVCSTGPNNRGATIIGNRIYGVETNNGAYYRHLCLQSNEQQFATQVLAANNLIIGSGTQVPRAYGIWIESLGQPANVPFYYTVFGNRVFNVANEYGLNGAALNAAPIHCLGPVQAEGTIQATGTVQAGGTVICGNHLLATGSKTGAAVAGGNQTVATASNANDIRGQVAFGSSGSTGLQVSVTFAIPYQFAPIVTIAPVNDATAGLFGWYITNVSATGFFIGTHEVLPAQATAIYMLAYHVIG